jgi:hypothetical protein
MVGVAVFVAVTVGVAVFVAVAVGVAVFVAVAVGVGVAVGDSGTTAAAEALPRLARAITTSRAATPMVTWYTRITCSFSIAAQQLPSSGTLRRCR